MSKHTPGPWTYSGGYVIDTSGTWVAIAASENGDADTRLITSAPDLLAACKDALDWINELLPAHASGGDRFDAIRAAIAKAEGRS